MRIVLSLCVLFQLVAARSRAQRDWLHQQLTAIKIFDYCHVLHYQLLLLTISVVTTQELNRNIFAQWPSTFGFVKVFREKMEKKTFVKFKSCKNLAASSMQLLVSHDKEVRTKIKMKH